MLAAAAATVEQVARVLSMAEGGSPGAAGAGAGAGAAVSSSSSSSAAAQAARLESAAENICSEAPLVRGLLYCSSSATGAASSSSSMYGYSTGVGRKRGRGAVGPSREEVAAAAATFAEYDAAMDALNEASASITGSGAGAGSARKPAAVSAPKAASSASASSSSSSKLGPLPLLLPPDLPLQPGEAELFLASLLPGSSARGNAAAWGPLHDFLATFRRREWAVYTSQGAGASAGAVAGAGAGAR